MAHEREPHGLDKLLQPLSLSDAPADMWENIQAELESPRPRVSVFRRPLRPALAAAAGLLALIGGGYVGVLRMYGAPSSWQILPVTGSPLVDGTSLTRAGDLGAGQWLTTDSVSVAQLGVGRIGTAEVGPNSRVRMDRGGRTEHRLTLAQGSLSAVIEAPPRLFFVETPSALATDLGCAYTIVVDSMGASWIHVTAGWVELKQGGRVSLVSTGLVAEVDIGGAPGTPYPVGMSDAARQALGRLDRGTGTSADLAAVFGALYPETGTILVRKQSAISLWHLLQRVEDDMRPAVYDRLTTISAPPAKVTMEGILALQRPMLERWRRDLNPMWSEEDVPMVVRAARRLWEWTMR